MHERLSIPPVLARFLDEIAVSSEKTPRGMGKPNEIAKNVLESLFSHIFSGAETPIKLNAFLSVI
ncbi:Hypothetical protein BSM4216_3709 [Bacillus smithii]|nr:Hypothetical protein BSM4216_3709 [Bacillus smithii]